MSNIIVYITVVLAATGADADTLDSFSTAEEYTAYARLDELITIDAFSDAAEYIVFGVPVTTIDVWATADDIRDGCVIVDRGPGTFDALGVAGDEDAVYRPYSHFTGGYGYGDKRVVILMYHRFRTPPTSKYEVPVEDFEWQMDFIDESGYEVISLPRFVEALHTGNADLIPGRSVIITIDDGYECVKRIAWPILQEHRFPFTVCLYTNYINTGGRSMTWAELRELASDPLVTVVSHSVSHSNLAGKRRTAGANYNTWLWQEIGGPKWILENGLGVDVDYFCWPYGSFNSECVNVAVAAGYRGMLTITTGRNTMDTSPYALKRYGVYSNAPRSIFAKIVLGRATYEEEYFFEYTGDAFDKFLVP